MLKRDNLPLGIVLGIFTPVLAFFLYYLLVFMPKHDVSLSEFMKLVLENRQTLPKLISVCLLLNGVIFYFYTRSRKDITAKGIFLVTMLYAITILFLKILHG
ncbi:hypothetical protein [Chitinophaga pinensis]|uniref:Uncharacterized protein n=1 Tax=Chitinophaga pinensis TaxID=79329 RepID=A0A5C6LZX8_9BACT|nr:hypothetical protein [Chitinophaga pinensis]TWW02170.1 hypothetical protein FEF09_03225 [Chitinophaga pinensis]